MAEHSHRVQKLRDAGYKLTQARLTVIDVLEKRQGHMTSNEVLEAVAEADPHIGRASVFRTLDLLTRLAIIRPTYIDSSMTPTYVLMPGGHHHHILCMNCYEVIEFDDCGLSELAHNLEERYGVEMHGHLLEFYGLCDKCRRKKTAEEDGE